MEYLQLYLHIIEANNIKEVEKNGNPDPYIRVMVPNAKGKLHELYKTETMKNTQNPKYELELLVRVPRNAESIVLELRDHNVLLKDKKLGSVVLSLNKISTQPQLENHTIDGGGVLKMCTRLVESLPGTPEPKCVEVLPKTRIHLERMIYHPGEVVRGYMIFTDRDLVKENEWGGVYFSVLSYWAKMHYLNYHQRLETTQGAPRLWAFQFLIPKRIPTVRQLDSPHELHLSIYPAAKQQLCIDCQLIIMPPFEGLEPNFSPRRPDLRNVNPNSLQVTWVDVPKIVYCERRNVFKFILYNSATETTEVRGLRLILASQRIDVELDSKLERDLVSHEFVRRDTLLEIKEPAPLEPSESREFSVVIDPKDDTHYRPQKPSAPFEITGDVQEQNYFLEVEIRTIDWDSIVISRKPFFWTSEYLTRSTPPNYQLTMEPDTFWVAPLEDPEAIYPHMAPSAVAPKIFPACNFQISEPLPADLFSRLRCETLEKLATSSEGIPPLTSIFEVPFE